LAWNYYTLVQIDSFCCKTFGLVTVDFPSVIWAVMSLGLLIMIQHGSIPNCLIVVWFISVSLMLQILSSNFVLFSEKNRCIGRNMRDLIWYVLVVSFSQCDLQHLGWSSQKRKKPTSWVIAIL
jgi:hypothetical protein